MPNISPTRLDTVNAIPMDQSEMGMRIFSTKYCTLSGTATPAENAESAAANADQNRFGQELKQDIAARSPDGHSDADLAGPLGHRDQHDVHDADARYDERDRGDQNQHQRQDFGNALRRVENRR